MTEVKTCNLHAASYNKQLATDLYHSCNNSCKEMGGATSVMPVIRDAFSQQSDDTIDWTVRCDWLQSASCTFLTSCSVATSCCISDEPCQWEMANFDPHSSEIS